MTALVFGNKSLVLHVARGLVGFGSLYLALHGYDLVGWPALLLLPVTLWMLKGCPVCWTIGLFETLAFRILNSEPIDDSTRSGDHTVPKIVQAASGAPQAEIRRQRSGPAVAQVP